jgi:hypothetical protein
VALFESKFVRHLQSLCPPKSESRRLLKHGFLIAEFVAQSDRSLYFHIGAASLSSGDWQITLLALTVCSKDQIVASLKA